MIENQGNRILVVDDEPDIIEFICYNLKKEGFRFESASNGKEALEKIPQFKPDLVLLDVMMPVMDGLEACRLMRHMPEMENAYIVFLTARSEEYSEISGFNAGADDYIAKPIKPQLLMSRLKAILRRKTKDEDLQTLHVGNLTIDRETFLVYRGTEKIQLARKEFELLFLLASRPGKVFKREQILEKVWGEDVLVVDRTIDVHVRKIREKLGDDYISTIKGVGYKFETQEIKS